MIGLAAVGAVFLLVVAVAKWGWAADEYAYWLAGRRIIDGLPIYDQAANAVTPTAFWYPPIVAQVIAPISAVVGWQVFAAGWIALMLGCLWWLAGRDVLTALALCAFPPVAVEFWWRNVHLILAVLLVLAIRRWGGWFAVAAGIKVAPVLGVAYLALRGRWREAGIALAFGLGLLAVSFALAPDAWRQFIEVALARGTSDAVDDLPGPLLDPARGCDRPDGRRNAAATSLGAIRCWSWPSSSGCRRYGSTP